MGKPFVEDMVRRTPPRSVFSAPADSPVVVGKRPRYLLWSVAVLSAGFLLLGLSFMFASAKVEVFPKIVNINLNDNFSASKEQGASLVFDLVILSGEKEKKLEATLQKEVAERATGTAVIFNSFSPAPQRLDIDTRLSGSNGKLYKTQKQITVPGMKTGGTPGSVEVPIYAAEAGEEYNSGPLDFQIVGFKGTPKYLKFKVRSKTGTEITGGFKGTTAVVSEEGKVAAAEELKVALEKELFKKAKGQIPDGFIMFSGGTAFVGNEVEMSLGEEELKVKLVGTLHGFLLEEKTLTQKIAEKKIADNTSSDIYIPEIENLEFNLASAGDISLQDMTAISFNISGAARIVSRPEVDKFKNELLGRYKKDFKAIVSEHQEIDRAELTVFPLWLRTLPERLEQVEVVVNYPDENNKQQ